MCGGYSCSKNALIALNILYIVSKPFFLILFSIKNFFFGKTKQLLISLFDNKIKKIFLFLFFKFTASWIFIDWSRCLWDPSFNCYKSSNNWWNLSLRSNSDINFHSWISWSI